MGIGVEKNDKGFKRKLTDPNEWISNRSDEGLQKEGLEADAAKFCDLVGGLGLILYWGWGRRELALQQPRKAQDNL